MSIRKVAAPAALAAAVAAAFAGLLGASAAEAACASFWGVGNDGQCHSEVGGFAIATHDTGKATAVGIGGAISVGGGEALSGGIFTAALASGAKTHATAVGVGSLAQDVANSENPGSAALSSGWFNRALNYGNGNTATATSADPPVVDLETFLFSVGNNTALNLGNGNVNVVNAGFSNGNYNVGDGNVTLNPLGGVLANAFTFGNGNTTVLAGLGAETLTVGDKNTVAALGNVQLANTFGNQNHNTLIPGAAENPNVPAAIQPNANFQAVLFGDRNTVTTHGNGNVTTVQGDDNEIVTTGKNPLVDSGYRNITNVIGDGNKVSPATLANGKTGGIRGNNNVTTIVGSLNKLRAQGNRILSGAFGNENQVSSTGDGITNHVAGDNQTSDKTAPSAP